MINGNSVIFQMGKESTYGTAGTATKQIKIGSESLKPVYNKIDEGLATGGRGAGLKATMGIGVEGSISTLMRPDLVYLLAGVLGEEATPVASAGGEGYKHVMTAIEASETKHLPAWTCYVDRKVGKFGYTGCKINRLALSAASGDYLKCDVDFVGKDEQTGVTMSTITGQPSQLRAFKFAQGKVYKVEEEERTPIADVDSIQLEINNNCDYQIQTTDTGDNYKEAEVGTREISLSLSAIYASGAEGLRASYYKSDATFAVDLEFVSDEMIDDEEPYKLTIKLPCCQMSDADANMGGVETLKQNMTMNVADNLSDELIIVEAVNADEAKYI